MRISGETTRAIAEVAAGCGLMAFTAGAAGGAAMAGIAVAGLGGAVFSHLRKHGPESQRALNAISDKVAQGFEAWAKVEGVSARADIAAADRSLRRHFKDCMLDREAVARAAGDPGGFPKAVADQVLVVLAARDPIFAAPGEASGASMIARDFARAVIEAALKAAIDNRAYFEALEPHLIMEIVAATGRIERKIDTVPEATAERVIQRLIEGGFVTPLKREIVEALSLLLPDSGDDINTMVLELIERVKAAESLIEEGHRPSNLDAFTQAVLKRVADRIEAKDFEGASEEADDAFAQWETQEEERRANEIRNGMAILDSGIQANTVRGDAPGIARNEIRKIELSFQSENQFDAIRAVQDRYYQSGLNRGVRLDLLVSIEIARLGFSFGQTLEAEATMSSDLAASLLALGERAGGSEGLSYLKEAVAGYDAALEVRTRSEMAVQWAMTQMNRATALNKLGMRAGGAGGLVSFKEAVAGYDAALEVFTRREMPTQWAITQMNRANALATMGERAGGAEGLASLKEAVAGYDAALEVYTRSKMHAYWAMTQMNRTTALQILGERAGGAEGLAYLEEAVAAYEAALKVYTRGEMPADWAMTQVNRANALQRLGERAGGAEGLTYLKEAVAGYDAALEVRTRSEMAVQWAMTQVNRAIAVNKLGKSAGGAEGLASLKQAVAGYDAALEVFTRREMPAQWAVTAENKAVALMAVAESGPHDAARGMIEEALALLRGALTIYEGGSDYDVETVKPKITRAEAMLRDLDE